MYKDDHSAKTFERPAFQQMLAFLKMNKKNADLLLFTKWDRFSHNAADAYGMINTLNGLGMEPQASKATNYKQYLDFGFNLLQNIDRVCVSGNTQIKSQILSLIFTEKLVFEGKSHQTSLYYGLFRSYLMPASVWEEIKKDKLLSQTICPLW